MVQSFIYISMSVVLTIHTNGCKNLCSNGSFHFKNSVPQSYSIELMNNSYGEINGIVVSIVYRANRVQHFMKSTEIHWIQAEIARFNDEFLSQHHIKNKVDWFENTSILALGFIELIGIWHCMVEWNEYDLMTDVFIVIFGDLYSHTLVSDIFDLCNIDINNNWAYFSWWNVLLSQSISLS